MTTPTADWVRIDTLLPGAKFRDVSGIEYTLDHWLKAQRDCAVSVRRDTGATSWHAGCALVLVLP